MTLLERIKAEISEAYDAIAGKFWGRAVDTLPLKELSVAISFRLSQLPDLSVDWPAKWAELEKRIRATRDEMQHGGLELPGKVAYLNVALGHMHDLVPPPAAKAEEKPKRPSPPPMILAKYQDRWQWCYRIQTYAGWYTWNHGGAYCHRSRIQEVDREASDPQALRLYDDEIANAKRDSEVGK